MQNHGMMSVYVYFSMEMYQIISKFISGIFYINILLNVLQLWSFMKIQKNNSHF